MSALAMRRQSFQPTGQFCLGYSHCDRSVGRNQKNRPLIAGDVTTTDLPAGDSPTLLGQFAASKQYEGPGDVWFFCTKEGHGPVEIEG
jgi:hypothetical protein